MDPTITQSVNCHACGYDLRGLKESGRCPECGLHIRFTLEQRYNEEELRRQAVEEDDAARRWTEQAERADHQAERFERQLDQSEAQAARMDRILDRWEAIQARIEILLDRLEQDRR